MKPEIASFLKELEPAVEESAVWCDGQMSLSIRTYLGSKSPPLEYVTSVRCVLLHKEAVLHRRELGDWEQDSAFHPYAKLAELDLSPSNRLFLNPALHLL